MVYLFSMEKSLGMDNGDVVKHPINDFSKTFDKHQNNCTIPLAVLLASHHFKVYIGSSTLPIVVLTDHNSTGFLKPLTSDAL